MITSSGSLVLEAELYGTNISEVRWRGEFTAQCNHSVSFFILFKLKTSL